MFGHLVQRTCPYFRERETARIVALENKNPSAMVRATTREIEPSGEVKEPMTRAYDYTPGTMFHHICISRLRRTPLYSIPYCL
jgi:hypothetical protein